MGSNTSKTNGDITVHEAKNESENGCNSDPRSPTPEIIRTPLTQGKGGGKHNITKNVDLRKTFENAKGDEKLIHNNPILSAVIKNHLQSYDPRSPTQDFERTPIVIASVDVDEDGFDKQLLRLQGENCASPYLKDDNGNKFDSCEEATASPELVVPKNLCNGFYDMSLNETIKESEEPLGSSTASNDAIENNISQNNTEKPTMLLETNFDYVEAEKDNFEDGEENVPGIELIDNYIDVIKGIPLFQILDDDPRSPSIGIERTPIVVSKNINSDTNVEEMSDDTLIKVLQNTNAELRQTVTKPQDLNQDGLLIYEDDSTVLDDTPKKSKSANNNGCRTPLSCMKNKTETGHTRSKSANTLYDPNNKNGVPQKLTKRASHIPRLKSLSKPVKYVTTGSTVSLKNIPRVSGISGDCENTPPHSHRDKWDKDTSLVL